MIYLCAGVYPEGTTDYQFLGPLLEHHLEELAAQLFPSQCYVAPSFCIDDARVGDRRADRIAAAVAAYADRCTLFVIHSDGAGAPDSARQTQVDPGIARARAANPDLVALGCIPVREIEAWLLTDRDAFQALLGSAVDPELPADPEKELDPKAALRKILNERRVRPPVSIHAFFGERVRLATLRALPAFRAFEADLVEAVKQVARSQGHRP